VLQTCTYCVPASIWTHENIVYRIVSRCKGITMLVDRNLLVPGAADAPDEVEITTKTTTLIGRQVRGNVIVTWTADSVVWRWVSSAVAPSLRHVIGLCITREYGS